MAWLLIRGVGVWGNNVPVTWALDIVGYDWWIGVATGSLAIAAGLLLTGAAWRGPINRLAETVALVSVAAAGLYPIIHLGRPWFFYWNLPYTNTFLLWPQFRSPLFWDAVDIIACLAIALLFWFTGLLPDLACLRDRAMERALAQPDGSAGHVRRLRAQIYGIVAMGWRGSVIHWRRWNDAYRMIAAFALVLVVSLQTGAAVMFAGSVEPGWHNALLPLQYLLGAPLAGGAVLGMLLAVMAWLLPLDGLIGRRQFDCMAILLLALGLAGLYCAGLEAATTWLTGSAFDRAVLARRFAGAHGWSGWAALLGQFASVQLFWFRAARRSAAVLFAVGALVAFGGWADHFMVIVVTLQHDFLPSSDHPYAMDLVGVATFLGTTGLFALLFLLFVRFLPVVSIAALRHPSHAVLPPHV